MNDQMERSNGPHVEQVLYGTVIMAVLMLLPNCHTIILISCLLFTAVRRRELFLIRELRQKLQSDLNNLLLTAFRVWPSGEGHQKGPYIGEVIT